MKPFCVADLTILVPPLWEKPWDQYVAEAEGLDREFLVAQAVFARMLRVVPAAPATFEKVAWLAIWSRLFGALTGARGGSEWRSRFTVSVMARVAFEAALHLQAVMLPVLEEPDQLAGDDAEKLWDEVRDRLRGYAAWSLAGDESLNKRLRDPHTLAMSFDPRPERDFIKELGELRESWERLSGQRLEVVSDQEAVLDRSRAERNLAAEANRIAKWMTAPDLATWIAKLRRLERENRQARRGAVTLFQLFDLPPSVPAFLESRSLGFSYFGYLKGSGFIHGSSLAASLLAVDGVVAPDFANLGKGFEAATESVLSECRLIAVILELLATHLEPPRAAV